MQAVEQSSKEARAQEIMENFVRAGYKIFIDTCSLLHFSAEKFFLNVLPILQSYNAKIILPTRCCEELKKHSRNTTDTQLATNAADTLTKLKQLNKAGYIELRGEESDNFADNVFLTVFTKFRMKYNLLLITQDNNLAHDILALNESKSVNGKNVAVRQINQYGYLSKFYWDKSCTPNDNAKPEPVDAFQICTEITAVPDTPIKVQIPSTGASVYTSRDGINLDNGMIRIGNEVANGGEGTVYETNSRYVAKIYKAGKLTKRKQEKIKLMLTKKVQCEGVCYPVCALYNEQKEFVGYLMPKAKGIEIAKSVFQPMLFDKRLPGWKKRDTVELCVTILKKIRYLHNRNIILGDINPANILVVSPTEVYFVDSDSYQIEDFPCPVGTVTFTAPEIQGKRFGEFLRTMGNEDFAVATLLFMIMLPGKSPYAQQGGGSPIENIVKMDFSYPFGDESNKKTPDGKWRFMWSHLTYDIKEMFYNTFRKGGDHSTENNRYSTEEWLSAFKYYLKLLDSGKFGQQDKMSEDIFPTRFKKSSKLTYITCKLCGEEVSEGNCKNGICRDCLNKGETYRCKRCGKEIVYTNYQKLIKCSKKHELCQDCFEQGNQVGMRPVCVDCRRTFDITNRELDYYKSNGWDVPKRCKNCREAKKSSSRSRSYSSVSNTPFTPRQTPNSSPARHGTFCFITTAVCEYMGKNDDCPELAALRAFRDNWLKYQPGGRELIEEYYTIAPLIVSRLKASPQYAQCCEELWNEYILPCLSMISNGRYEECKQRYINMVRYMQNRFCGIAV
ncbi:MAG: zinc-ribbon domain containing protein [Prevotella sp.]|nr:zinc-ribbon domain containing protein [Prevotella sp.]